MVVWIDEESHESFLGQPERSEQEKKRAREGLIVASALLAFVVGLFWATVSPPGGSS